MTPIGRAYPARGREFSHYRPAHLRRPDLIRALACIKQAAAAANHQLGLLDAPRAEAIIAACIENSQRRAA